MSREKEYFKYDIPTSVVCLVQAVCADYKRREKIIKRGNACGDVLAKYILLNGTIDRAMSSVEAGIRADMLEDIAARRGYTKSRTQLIVAKNTYYRRRRKVIYDIAKDLSLL